MDLDLKRMIAAKPREHEMGPREPIMSPWGEALDPQHVLEEFPRPLMRRERWRSLNGWWRYAIVALADEDEAEAAWHDAQAPEHMKNSILVPFSPETSLSGVGRQLEPDELLWYRREVELPAAWSGLGRESHLLLHFEAVDWACSVYVNGGKVGEHVGGYLPADYDITDAVADASRLCIELCVWDPSETRSILRGKQRLDCGNIWYPAQSGIWQSVWLEWVPKTYIQELRLIPDADEGRLVVRARIAGLDEGAAQRSRVTTSLSLRVMDEGRVVAMGSCAPGRSGRCVMTLALAGRPHLWSCEDPHLYDVEARCGDDLVLSYCAFRTVGVETDERGVPRFFLNHKPLLLKGILDQGYWPESLMTAPSDDALLADIEAARKLGFNMMRKHLKIESSRWYWHCDRLGMLVWQDMVSGGGPYDPKMTSYLPTLFPRVGGALGDTRPREQKALGADDPAYKEEWEKTCRAMLRLLGGHPSIVTWGLFNEGFGQFDAERMCELVGELDPTRPVDAASGWQDQGTGDYFSVHNYFRTLDVWPDRQGARRGRRRAFVISECGGLTLQIEEHSAYAKAYGYASFASARQWRGAVRSVLDELDALWDKGLAAYVWCELSDVEEEVNGLLSYDRRVNKLGSRHRPLADRASLS